MQTKDANGSGPYNYPLILQPVNGNVGIGTTSPSSPAGVGTFLHIADSSHAGIVLEDTGSTSWDIYNADGHIYFYDESTSANKIIFSAGGNATFGGDVLPTTTNTQRLGSNSVRWQHGYFANTVYAGTFSGNLSGGTISGSTGTFSGDISLNKDDGFIYLNNVGTGNDGAYIRATSGDNIRQNVPAGKYFEWEVGGSQKLKLDSSGNATFAGNVLIGGKLNSVGDLTLASDDMTAFTIWDSGTVPHIRAHGAIQAANGTVGAPAYAFYNQASTGMYLGEQTNYIFQ